ncbi:hypothetical protein Slin15195_G060380 [Septoria linicola]|uniref:Uncharacterized protein n=1 Tax=Septoria linicola TaxID=215465 RepID=A0A9Q9AQP1_9PEZI|nr:hypothetical protein Slin15195_G060380 [Septoria linicola]
MGANTSSKQQSPIKADKGAVTMNGHPNGTIHHGQQQAQQRASRSKRKARTTTWTGWAADKGLKLFVWYALYQIVFQCPSSQSQIDDSTNQVCKTYLQGRDVVTPYAQPYYTQYVAPYVQQAQPYYDIVNEKAYKPGYAAYQTYAAPRVAQAHTLSQQQWETTIKPQLDLAQQQAGKHYQQTLAPHVKKATDVVQPYYDGVVNSAADIWQLELEPVYRKTAPYAEKIYQQGQSFAVNTALPQAQWVGSTAWSLWARQVWPRIRILYGENVEPQLMRITERLGRYKDGKKLEAEINSVEASSSLVKASSSAESAASSLSSTISEATESPSSAASAAVHSTPTPAADPAIQFKEDLKSWEEISHKAAEEGSEDLAERIHDITAQQVKSANSVGSALVTQLEGTTESSLNSVKSRIQQIVKSLPEDAEEKDIEAANDDLVQAVRAAGQSIKQKAQAVREWRHTRQSETESLVEKALQSTLETIDSIRELRLTEIGRKYASSSLPHKEWSKYNDIKKATQTWRNDVEQAARGHKGLAQAKAAGEEIEQVAMGVAEDAAKELGRLKKVGQWKIAADDASDDFETKTIPPPVRKAKDYIVEQAAAAAGAASQVVYGEEQDTVESATPVVAEKASQAASQASEAVYGSTGSAESVASQASSAASSLSEKVVGSSTGSVESAASQVKQSASSIASQVSSSAVDAASSASSAAVGESSFFDTVKQAASSASSAIVGESSLADTASSVASKVSSSAASLSSQVSNSVSSASKSASSAVVGESSLADTIKDAASSASSAVIGESSLTDSVTDAASSATESAKSISPKLASALAAQREQASRNIESAAKAASDSYSSIVNKATHTPVPSEVSSSVFSASSAVSSAAGSVYDNLPDAEDIADAAEEAAQKPRKVFAGAMAQELKEPREPILDGEYEDVVDTGDLGASYSESVQQIMNAAGDKASQLTQAIQEALNGASPTQGSVESATSLANEQYESALSAASSALFGTQNAADKATSSVYDQYQAAVTAASYAIYGTPATAAPLAAASSVYDNAASQASSQYDVVKSYISAQISGTPLPVQEQVLANAQAAYSSAITAASYAAYGTPVTAAPLAAASSVYNNALNEASKSYASLQSRVSSAIYVAGTAEPVQDQLLASAQSAYSSAVTAASYAAYGTPATAAPLAAASSAYASAALEASKHYDAVMSRVSAQISGTPKPVQEQMYASAESAYSNALNAASARYYSTFPTQGYVESISSVASSRLAEGISAAQEQYRSAKIAVGAEPTPAHQQYLASAQAAYYQALGLAHGRYNDFVEAASSAIAPTPTATGYQKSIDDALSAARSAYTAYTSEASSKYSVLHEMASNAASAQTTTVDKGTVDHLEEQIVDAVALAKSKLADASKSVSSAYAASATTDKPLASQASENWDALISKASEQVYGAPPPYTALAYSYATEYAGSVTEAAAYATAAAAAQFEQVQALFSELVVGKEADFTASVYSRLQSAYSTGAPALASQVSSYASDSYDSISSVVSAAFIPPTQVPTILEQVQEQLNAAVNAASVQAYGTEKGTFEQATEAAASVYSAAASQASEAIYGIPAPYVAAAQASVIDIGASASSAISAAIYGGPTPTLEAASNAAASVASSIQSKAAVQAASASAAVSSAIYGEEQTYLEGVQSQLSAAMASASSRIAEFGGDAGSAINEAASTASSVAEEAASSVSSAVTAATDRVRDEL